MKTRTGIKGLLALCLTFSFLSSLAQQNKYALIIGVKSYQYVQPLQNSLNDARDMAAALKSKGFQVIESYDPKTKREMQDAIRKYFALLQGQPNAAGLVFYSGHGMQVKGVNYLIPTQADPQLEADLDDQCVNMDYVMRAIEQAGNGLNIFILDACRNNPFRGFTRSGEKGLSMVDTPKGSYIVYSTKPGSVASDGTGRNGLFTSKLLQFINSEGLNIEQVFKRTAHEVAAASGDAQRPWIASDYTGDFFFTPSKTTSAQTNPAQTQPLAKADVKKEEVKSDEVKRDMVTKSSGFDYGYGAEDAAVVTAGSKEWIAKNLNVTTFSNGDLIPEAKTSEEWTKAEKEKKPAWCYYNNDPSNGAIYGKLYNWYAVTDPRGLAPKGWHIPSENEWTALIKSLGGPSAAGNKLKGLKFWKGNKNGTNESGLSANPGGYRKPYGDFNNFGEIGYWWSSTESGPGRAWHLYLSYINGVAYPGKDYQGCGFSVRCVKD